jgi:hypothetical protein
VLEDPLALQGVLDGVVRSLTESLDARLRQVAALLGEKRPGVRDVGLDSTLAGILLVGDQAFCFYLGDSPVFRLREGRCEFLSRPHSTAQGQIARCVMPGMCAAGFWPETKIEPCRVGDVYFVASDGFLDPFLENYRDGVRDFELMFNIFATEERELELLDINVERDLVGDNYTAIMVRVGSPIGVLGATRVSPAPGKRLSRTAVDAMKARLGDALSPAPSAPMAEWEFGLHCETCRQTWPPVPTLPGESAPRCRRCGQQGTLHNLLIYRDQVVPLAYDKAYPVGKACPTISIDPTNPHVADVQFEVTVTSTGIEIRDGVIHNENFVRQRQNAALILVGSDLFTVFRDVWLVPAAAPGAGC